MARTYTLDELEHLAAEFVDANDASANPHDSSALRYRLYLSMFVVFLRNQPDDNVLDFQPKEMLANEQRQERD